MVYKGTMYVYEVTRAAVLLYDRGGYVHQPMAAGLIMEPPFR